MFYKHILKPIRIRQCSSTAQNCVKLCVPMINVCSTSDQSNQDCDQNVQTVIKLRTYQVSMGVSRCRKLVAMPFSPLTLTPYSANNWSILALVLRIISNSSAVESISCRQNIFIAISVHCSTCIQRIAKI